MTLAFRRGLATLDGVTLTTTDHDRGAAGLTYVYPVVSRRAGGVSVGVNLNPNNACNWRCVYCQVPELIRGAGPPIDLARLRDELRSLLDDVLHGDFMTRHVPEGARRLNDIALSGNGEPTTSPQLAEVLEVIASVRAELGVGPGVKTVLITNGSMLDRPAVLAAIERLRALEGEVWFKLDAGTREGIQRANSVSLEPATHLARLRACAARCPTWIQTCVYALDGRPAWDERERAAYLEAIRSVAGSGVRGVLLYGLARESHQPEAPRLSALPAEWLSGLARDIEAAGLPARVSV